MKEHKFQDDFIEDLRAKGAMVTSIVGNMYVVGEPDVEIISARGQIIKVELKVWRGDLRPSRAEILFMLRASQRNKILRGHWIRNAPSLIIAHLPNEPDRVFIITKLKETFDFYDSCVMKLAHAQPGVIPYN